MELIKELGGEILRSVKDMAWVLTPPSKKKREIFLDEVREKVDYYKPRIEDKCNIDIGEIKVKDNKHWLSDTIYSETYSNTFNHLVKQGKLPTKIDFHANFLIASIIEGLSIIPSSLFNMLRGAYFRQNNNKIYVPFNYMNRFLDIRFKKRKEIMDYGVVHELSHILWKNLGGNNTSFGLSREVFEGFATYCADDYFSNFYPKGTKKMDNLPELYTKGKKRIENIVNKNGEQIILEIPKRWEELIESELHQKTL